MPGQSMAANGSARSHLNAKAAGLHTAHIASARREVQTFSVAASAPRSAHVYGGRSSACVRCMGKATGHTWCGSRMYTSPLGAGEMASVTSACTLGLNVSVVSTARQAANQSMSTINESLVVPIDELGSQ